MPSTPNREPVPWMRGHLLFTCILFVPTMVVLFLLPPIGAILLGALVVWAVRAPRRHRAQLQQQWGW